ncbi:hypothetical protein BB8028_0002g01670 [Beauveria bassiana]|uniref:Uncharacterized protein n=1 Tax=Beauveria bassiana TaxID=176275 RepID=A0A2S7Y1P4_BEABA|nr:hypothetical protein BB8028_0002g01670 [Beauveria bassiana]
MPLIQSFRQSESQKAEKGNEAPRQQPFRTGNAIPPSRLGHQQFYS